MATLFEELSAGKQNKLGKIRARYQKFTIKPKVNPVIIDKTVATALVVAPEKPKETGMKDDDEKAEEKEEESSEEEDEDGFTIKK